MLRFIRNRVRTDEDAEDIVQDVLAQLTESFDAAAPIERLAAWLFAVARNRIIDWYRKRRPESLAGAENDDEESLAELLTDPSDNPERAYARSLMWSELDDALDELPRAQRDAFVMHQLEGRSFREMSEETGVPVNTLLSRKHSAVLFLRERLYDLYDQLDQF